MAGQQYEYAFDSIGNRLQTKNGGDKKGNHLRLANYSPNLLNQYTSREVPGAGVAFMPSEYPGQGLSSR